MPTSNAPSASGYSYKSKPSQIYYDYIARGIAIETQEGTGDQFITAIMVHPKNARLIPDFGGRLNG